MVSAKVFISSVILGLEKERDAVEQTISSLELLPNRFETWPAYPDKPPEICIQEVADSEIFILILGNTISDIVIEEYKTAKESVPHRILVFVKDIQRNSDAEIFFNRIRKEYSYKKFSSIDELCEQVKKGIQSLFFTTLFRIPQTSR